MTIQLTCPSCGAKLKVKDELAGRTGKCPQCKARMEIPAAAPAQEAAPTTAKAGASPPAKSAPTAPAAEASASVADQLFEEDFASAQTLEQKAAAAAAQVDPNERLKIDDLFGDEPMPQIILSGGEKAGAAAAKATAAPTSAAGAAPKPTQAGERMFDPDELPRLLGKLNHYLICDHKDVVARWENDGRGWMIHLKDGFTRASTVENQIPQFGNFILVEVGVERQADGLHLKNITTWQLRRQYALTKIAKGDDAVLETIIDYAQLNDRQRKHVKDLVKTKFLPHMWGEMEAILAQ
jgi:hypothetical protein